MPYSRPAQQTSSNCRKLTRNRFYATILTSANQLRMDFPFLRLQAIFGTLSEPKSVRRHHDSANLLAKEEIITLVSRVLCCAARRSELWWRHLAAVAVNSVFVSSANRLCARVCACVFANFLQEFYALKQGKILHLSGKIAESKVKSASRKPPMKIVNQ